MWGCNAIYTFIGELPALVVFVHRHRRWLLYHPMSSRNGTRKLQFRWFVLFVAVFGQFLISRKNVIVSGQSSITCFTDRLLYYDPHTHHKPLFLFIIIYWAVLGYFGAFIHTTYVHQINNKIETEYGLNVVSMLRMCDDHASLHFPKVAVQTPNTKQTKTKRLENKL